MVYWSYKGVSRSELIPLLFIGGIMKNFLLGSVLTLLVNYCIGCTFMLYKVGGKKCSS